jgi:hypothetical protein
MFHPRISTMKGEREAKVKTRRRRARVQHGIRKRGREGTIE